MRAHIQHEGLTINVDRREDDAVEGSDGREKQRSCQASIPEPFCFSSKYASCYEDIVSVKERVEGALSPAPSLYLYALESAKWRTYKTLEPGPYWPDTGHAHMTCRALLAAFVAGGDGEE